MRSISLKQGDVDALKEAMNASVNDGMQTFDQALFQLYAQGRISLQEALENADSATDLKLKVKLSGATLQDSPNDRHLSIAAEEDSQAVGE